MENQQIAAPIEDWADPKDLTSAQTDALLEAIGKRVQEINKPQILEIIETLEGRGGLYHEAYQATMDPGARDTESVPKREDLDEERLLRLAWLTSIHPADVFETAAVRGMPVGDIRREARAVFDEVWANESKGSTPTLDEAAEKTAMAEEAERVAVYTALSQATKELGAVEFREILSGIVLSGRNLDPEASYIGRLEPSFDDRDFQNASLTKPEMLRLAWAGTLTEENLQDRARALGVDVERVLEAAGETTLEEAEKTVESDAKEPEVTRNQQEASEPVRVRNQDLWESAEGIASVERVLLANVESVEAHLNSRDDLDRTQKKTLAEFLAQPESALLLISEASPAAKLAVAEISTGLGERLEIERDLPSNERQFVRLALIELDSARQDKSMVHDGGLEL